MYDYSPSIGNVENRFVPYQSGPEKVARYSQATDICVHPAWDEALACDTPTMASAVGGIPEQIVEGRRGFLVSVGDARDGGMGA